MEENDSRLKELSRKGKTQVKLKVSVIKITLNRKLRIKELKPVIDKFVLSISRIVNILQAFKNRPQYLTRNSVNKKVPPLKLRDRLVEGSTAVRETVLLHKNRSK